MKTTKHSVLFLAATLATSFSFAQSVIGITHSANAALNSSVNSAAAQAATRASANAATRASVQATSNARAAVNTTAAKSAQVTTGVASNTKADVNTKAAVKADAGIKAQAGVHASENGRAHANENAAMLRTGTATNSDVNVAVNGSEIIDAGAQKGEALKKEAAATGTTTIKTSEKTKVKAESGIATKEAQTIRTAGDVKEDFRAKSQGAVHASETAKEHANDNSAVVNSKTTTSTNARADKDNVKISGAAKTSGKLKVAKQ